MRDVFDCCRYFQGLRPGLETCTVDSGKTLRLLVLDGVIPITYRAVTYQIPVKIWCRPLYPNEAPIAYVRPTPTMVIRERHSNVDREGRVYLQHYLSIWDPVQFTLYGLVVAMIRVFSVEPPVNSRPSQSTTQTDEPDRRRLVNLLAKRLSDRLVDVNNDAITEIGQILERKDIVTRNSQHATEEAEAMISRFTKVREDVERLTRRRDDLKSWIDAMGDSLHDTDVDVILQYRDIMYHQIAECLAKDHAYTDTLDQVDEAFVKGVIDHETYVKDVRNLSREQFFPRALRKKLELARVRMYRAEREKAAKGKLVSSPTSPNSSFATPA